MSLETGFRERFPSNFEARSRLRTRSSPGGRRAAGQTLKANDKIARSDRADQEMDFGVGICNEGIRSRDIVIGGVVAELDQIIGSVGA